LDITSEDLRLEWALPRAGRCQQQEAYPVRTALLIAAIIYLAEPARSIPSFLPGHLPGVAAHHNRGAIALFILAAILWVLSGVASFVAKPRHGRGVV
ncbi:MAG: hypothetical protein ACRD0E_08365, partial [Acidimicrobiales bacterium]